MKLLTNLFQSSLGKKFIMAVTGLGLFLFVIGHMVGNLQIFLGAELLNSYGHFLQSSPEILWPARIGLLAMVGLHIWAAITLRSLNNAARPVAYDGAPVPTATTYASRTMVMSGLIIFCFIVYHLLHFTVMVDSLNLTGKSFATLKDARGYHDVYALVVLGFSKPLVSGFYILGMALLCLHLSHGVQALFQSLGLRNPAYAPLTRKFAKAMALVIFIGNSSIPLSVLLGIVK